MMKRILISFIFLLVAGEVFAAINAQYGFESGFPHFVKSNGNGTVELSQDKFKDGASSVKFSWNGQAELVFMNFSDIEASMKVNHAGLMMWVYNTEAMKEPLRFTFVDWSGNEICLHPGKRSGEWPPPCPYGGQRWHGRGGTGGPLGHG